MSRESHHYYEDIDHGVRSGLLRTDDQRVIDLVRSKLAVPGSGPIDISDSKHRLLKRQVQGQLRPVLREPDYAAFDLERAFGIVVQLAVSLQ